MFIQTKVNPQKSEAKILLSTYPFRLLNILNGGNGNGNQNHTSSFIYSSCFNNTTTTENGDDDYGEDSNTVHLLDSAHNVASTWDIELIIGQFTKETAFIFSRTWISKSRGIESRRERGLSIFKEYLKIDASIKCYNKRLVPLNPPLNFWFNLINCNDFCYCGSSSSSSSSSSHGSDLATPTILKNYDDLYKLLEKVVQDVQKRETYVYKEANPIRVPKNGVTLDDTSHAHSNAASPNGSMWTGEKMCCDSGSLHLERFCEKTVKLYERFSNNDSCSSSSSLSKQTSEDDVQMHEDAQRDEEQEYDDDNNDSIDYDDEEFKKPNIFHKNNNRSGLVKKNKKARSGNTIVEMRLPCVVHS